MKTSQDIAGFTLIEVLIVVILLGITATIIVPQISVSSEDTKLNTLKTNLKHLRNAIQLYHYQHDNTYPGAKNSAGNPSANEGQANSAFINQLTQYSKLNGSVSSGKTSLAIYGPYIKADSLPVNTYNDLNNVKCDINSTDITAKASDGTTAWKFYTKTGILLANDGGHDNL